ncbi:hypothetical protein C0J52_19672 [Blattella germanica]|nr:hypothetical protein C0J52_19672 [Blattella germanica]
MPEKIHGVNLNVLMSDSGLPVLLWVLDSSQHNQLLANKLIQRPKTTLTSSKPFWKRKSFLVSNKFHHLHSVITCYLSARK